MGNEVGFTRVDAKLQIGCRKISKEEAMDRQSSKGSKDTSISEFPTPPNVDDPALQQWLEMINTKLDHILSNTGKAEVSTSTIELKVRPVNLSAAGAIFPTDLELSNGDLIEIEMILPMKTPMTMVMLAKVLKFSEPVVTAKFFNVSQEIRQTIADYVFYREREILMAERL
jgi:hypothetical protein